MIFYFYNSDGTGIAWRGAEKSRIPGVFPEQTGGGKQEKKLFESSCRGFIMEKRTAERENPLLFFCFSELLSRWNGTTEADLFSRKGWKRCKSMRVKNQCQGG